MTNVTRHRHTARVLAGEPLPGRGNRPPTFHVERLRVVYERLAALLGVWQGPNTNHAARRVLTLARRHSDGVVVSWEDRAKWYPVAADAAVAVLSRPGVAFVMVPINSPGNPDRVYDPGHERPLPVPHAPGPRSRGRRSRT